MAGPLSRCARSFLSKATTVASKPRATFSGRMVQHPVRVEARRASHCFARSTLIVDSRHSHAATRIANRKRTIPEPKNERYSDKLLTIVLVGGATALTWQMVWGEKTKEDPAEVHAKALSEKLLLASTKGPTTQPANSNFFQTISRRPLSIDKEGKLYKLEIDGVEFCLEKVGSGNFNEVYRFRDKRRFTINDIEISDLSQCILKLPLHIPKGPLGPLEAYLLFNDFREGLKKFAEKETGYSLPKSYWLSSKTTMPVNIADMTKGHFLILEYIPESSVHVLDEWRNGEGYASLSPRAKKMWDFLQNYATQASANASLIGDLKQDNIRYRTGKIEPVVVDFVITKDNGRAWIVADLATWYNGNTAFLNHVTLNIADKELKDRLCEEIKEKYKYASSTKK